MSEVRELQHRVGVWRNRFIALFDRTPVPTAICQLNGEITAANPALAELLGTSPSALPDRAITDLLQAKVYRDFERLVQDLSTGRRTRRTLAVRWASGSGQCTAQAVADEEGVALLLTIQPDPLPHRDVPLLTERESAILRLIAGGATSAAVAAELGITADGVNYHLTRLAARLEVPNRPALIARSYTLGLLDSTAWPPH